MAQTKRACPSSIRPCESSHFVRGDGPSRRKPPERLSGFFERAFFFFEGDRRVASARTDDIHHPLRIPHRRTHEPRRVIKQQKPRISLRTFARAYVQPHVIRFRAAARRGAFAQSAARVLFAAVRAMLTTVLSVLNI